MSVKEKANKSKNLDDIICTEAQLKVAKNINEVKKSVIMVIGEWGCGKTTIINKSLKLKYENENVKLSYISKYARILIFIPKILIRFLLQLAVRFLFPLENKNDSGTLKRSYTLHGKKNNLLTLDSSRHNIKRFVNIKWEVVFVTFFSLFAVILNYFMNNFDNIKLNTFSSLIIITIFISLFIFKFLLSDETKFYLRCFVMYDTVYIKNLDKCNEASYIKKIESVIKHVSRRSSFSMIIESTHSKKNVLPKHILEKHISTIFDIDILVDNIETNMHILNTKIKTEDGSKFSMFIGVTPRTLNNFLNLFDTQTKANHLYYVIKMYLIIKDNAFTETPFSLALIYHMLVDNHPDLLLKINQYLKLINKTSHAFSDPFKRAMINSHGFTSKIEKKFDNINFKINIENYFNQDELRLMISLVLKTDYSLRSSINPVHYLLECVDVGCKIYSELINGFINKVINIDEYFKYTGDNIFSHNENVILTYNVTNKEMAITTYKSLLKHFMDCKIQSVYESNHFRFLFTSNKTLFCSKHNIDKAAGIFHNFDENVCRLDCNDIEELLYEKANLIIELCDNQDLNKKHLFLYNKIINASFLYWHRLHNIPPHIKRGDEIEKISHRFIKSKYFNKIQECHQLFIMLLSDINFNIHCEDIDTCIETNHHSDGETWFGLEPILNCILGVHYLEYNFKFFHDKTPTASTGKFIKKIVFSFKKEMNLIINRIDDDVHKFIFIRIARSYYKGYYASEFEFTNEINKCLTDMSDLITKKWTKKKSDSLRKKLHEKINYVDFN